MVLLSACSRGAKVCAVCQRDECKAMAFRITRDDGKIVETCCARCGLHYLESSKPPRRVEATDFATGHWIDAAMAMLVSGSDMRGCAMPETRRDSQGCCMYMAYDRCLPSLIAFESRDAAAAFTKKHGGDLAAWEQLRGKSE